MARLLKLQRDSRRRSQAPGDPPARDGRLDQLDLDHLQAAELNQRQVARSLTSRSDGVPMHMLALLADLENNRVDSPDIQRRMQALLAEIERLDREHLPPDRPRTDRGDQVGPDSAGQADEPRPRPTTTRPAPALAERGQAQDEVIAALEAMLGQLKQWDDYRRFHRDLAQLLRDQEELAAAGGRTGPRAR